MPIKFGAKFVKPIIHVDDLDDLNVDDRRPLPSHGRFQHDPRVKAEHVEHVSVKDLKPSSKNAKQHPERQISLLEENINEFGFTNPLIVDENNTILAGHARWEAAKRLGLEYLPVVRLTHLSPAQKRAAVIADNKLAELGAWDFDILAEEFEFLTDPDSDISFDYRITGFDTPEIDDILDDKTDIDRHDPEDDIAPPVSRPTVTLPGDLWDAGQHKLICADATVAEAYERLMQGERAQISFNDFPFNVPNEGHVTKRKGVREFAMGNGEMSQEEFTNFLTTLCKNIAANSASGGIGYFCMDWRHMSELKAAADLTFQAFKNLVIWVKPNAGMGSFYRSQHELIFVYAVAGKPINNFGLGGKGRHRSNVWKYPGLSSFGRGRDETLAMHPTVKPVAMVVDALKDCSNRGDIVLDVCAGSGTTMIAAEKTGRRARVIEIDPGYCDVIIRRWQTLTGNVVRLKETNETFEQVAARRGIAERSS